MNKNYWLFGSIAFAVASSCGDSYSKKAADNIRFSIPASIKDSIYETEENPFSLKKAQIGRYFFYDRRLSVNQSKSCSSCHDQRFAFTDGYRRSIGAMGDNVQHNAPSLVNVIFNKYLTHADSSIRLPEQQINNPMFHSQPIELGWRGNEQLILDRLKKDSFYLRQMSVVFPSVKDPFTVKNIQYCIINFIKTILSFNSPFDNYRYRNDTNALSFSQKNGMDLFYSKRLGCSNCHSGINFSTPVLKDNDSVIQFYQNTGLYNIDNAGGYPANDQGLIEITGNITDMGKFRVASLRNLAYTAPYFHDGSAASLEDVIDIYIEGGRNNTTGIYAGDGRKNLFKNPLINGIPLTSQEKKDLIGFLLSLSDSSICNNPLYANPFKEDETKK